MFGNTVVLYDTMQGILNTMPLCSYWSVQIHIEASISFSIEHRSTRDALIKNPGGAIAIPHPHVIDFCQPNVPTFELHLPQCSFSRDSLLVADGTNMVLPIHFSGSTKMPCLHALPAWVFLSLSTSFPWDDSVWFPVGFVPLLFLHSK